MTCRDNIAELLPWFVNGTLSEEERRKVERHLEVCPLCRDSLKALEWFSESMRTYASILPAEHIDPQKLVTYAESKDELTESELKELEDHLSHCADCRKELDTLLRVHADMVQDRSPLSGLSHLFGRIFSKGNIRLLLGSWGRFAAAIGKLMFKPAFAYILILILLYPAWLGLRSSIREPRILQDMEWRLSDMKEQNQALESK
jgi:hypothetical protein